MKHKITIEIIIKTDFLKPKEQTTSKVHALHLNPTLIQSLMPKLMEGFVKNLAQEFPKESKEVPKEKPKSKKVVKKWNQINI